MNVLDAIAKLKRMNAKYQALGDVTDDYANGYHNSLDALEQAIKNGEVDSIRYGSRILTS